ncbi:PREDICTED: putative phosphoenolpyruvate synthase [Priapulus caudatus]|uniref:Phosphoenolpyruvate synthase n=1 Tax=Priapulus caudatus TaxID=37621 RepID=A0ABM1F9I1_PRICU|nr:PREDICTED: putative phosphoenolpyruvate synthase [Priapulus caudatus]
MFPALRAIKFPEFSFGYPTPIQDIAEEETHDNVSYRLQGMPVSHGVVRSRCRIVATVADAHAIQAGDILITDVTDVGWSPYYGLIGGLVTEKGGLLSHGAVVAREYGLPCIVSAKNAMTIFKNGDEAILNGTTGFIEKANKEEPEPEQV